MYIAPPLLYAELLMKVILAPAAKTKGVESRYSPPPELDAELLTNDTLAAAAMFSNDPKRKKAPSSRSVLFAKRILPDNMTLLLNDVTTFPILLINREFPPKVTVLFLMISRELCIRISFRSISFPCNIVNPISTMSKN